jgi:hypothetical protein
MLPGAVGSANALLLKATAAANVIIVSLIAPPIIIKIRNPDI